jgi:hypothetical protein
VVARAPNEARADATAAADGANAGGADGGGDASDGGLGGDDTCPEGGFCDDFDTPPLGATWTTTNVSGNATLYLDDAGSVSPPYALRMFLSLQSPGPERHAELIKTLTPGHGVQCRMNVFIDQAPPSGDATLITITPTNPELQQHDLFVTFNTTGMIRNQQWKFGDGGGDIDSQNMGPTPQGKWFRLGFVTDYTNATITIDGTMAFNGALAFASTPTKLQVAVGERYDTEKGPASVLFDDYQCVVTP